MMINDSNEIWNFEVCSLSIIELWKVIVVLTSEDKEMNLSIFSKEIIEKFFYV